MSKINKKGVYKITNNEGALCNVNTANKSSAFYGKYWAGVCESYLNGKVIAGKLDRYRYRSNNGEPENANPTGFVVKIGPKIEAFLPMSLTCKFRDYTAECSKERIAVMVEEFDPKSSNVIVRELKVADPDFDINLVNEALTLIGMANEEGKYVMGTIIGESLNKKKNRAGYIVSINGVEAFLPSSHALIPFFDIQNVIGHNVFCSVEGINIDRMSIILSATVPYEKLLQDQAAPELRSETRGLVGWVTSYNTYVFLPNNILGIIPRSLNQNISHGDWINLTGRMVVCIPYKKKVWKPSMQDFQYFISLKEGR